MPVQQVKELPQLGEPYAPPAQAAQASPITTGSVQSPRPPDAPFSLPERAQPGFAEKLGGFFAGLSGPDALASFQQRGDRARDRDTARFSQNQTYQALIGKGVDEATARAAVSNPDILRSVLPNVFGGGQTDDWKEYTLAKKEGFEGSFVDFKQQTKRTNQPIKIDAGTSWQLIDPVTRETISIIPKDIAGSAQQKALGTAQGGAQADLPRAVETATNMLQQIEGVMNSPALARSVGPMDQWRPSLSADATDFDARLGQIKGQSFLQAFQSLKGGGAITEVEGQKATDAIGRLSRAQDEQTFQQALMDLRDVVTRGLARAQAQASGDFSGQTIPGSEITRGGTSTGGWSARKVN
jgi:hypothetical protein